MFGAKKRYIKELEEAKKKQKAIMIGLAIGTVGALTLSYVAYKKASENRENDEETAEEIKKTKQLYASLYEDHDELSEDHEKLSTNLQELVDDYMICKEKTKENCESIKTIFEGFTELANKQQGLENYINSGAIFKNQQLMNIVDSIILTKTGLSPVIRKDDQSNVTVNNGKIPGTNNEVKVPLNSGNPKQFIIDSVPSSKKPAETLKIQKGLKPNERV